jgi:hypothetical protein
MRSQIAVAVRGERRQSLRRVNERSKPGPIAVAVEPVDFARVVGQEPKLEPVGMEVLEDLQAICETFGPPERVNSTVYWNFVDRGGKSGTLYHAGSRKQGVLTFKLAADGKAEGLQQWVFDRVAHVTNGDSAPMFLGSAKYEIRRVA